MESLVALILVIGLPIAYYAYKEYKSPGSVRPVNEIKGVDYGPSGRHCLVCGYEGKMKTWLSNYSAPQFIILLGLLFFIIPGLIFIALFWGKYKCPNCGAIGKNREIRHEDSFRQPPQVIAPPISLSDELQRLAKLNEQGALSKEEFQTAKKKLLG
ncbi:MAG: SHOCT domain-containing protein [Syntrophobacterales bacterium]|nr:SHOCT domain-containing protein [Syntrophobacterales bacterium]